MLVRTSPPTSLTLLDQLRGPGGADAWDRFDRLYRPLLLGWAARAGFGAADAADLAQEVMLKLARALPRYERPPGGSFRGWLYRVTANAAHDLRRNRATRPLPSPDGLSGHSAAPAPEAAFEEVEYRRAVVNRALELIRPEFAAPTWAAFELLMVRGMSASEVAERVGVTANAVYLARHRVLTRLRAEVDGLLD